LRDVPSSEVEHFDLPRSLRPGEARGTQKARFVAGAPKDGAEEKAGHPGKRHAGHQRRAPVGMTEWEKAKQNQEGGAT
jgi:hypothetical protein